MLEPDEVKAARIWELGDGHLAADRRRMTTPPPVRLWRGFLLPISASWCLAAVFYGHHLLNVFVSQDETRWAQVVTTRRLRPWRWRGR